MKQIKGWLDSLKQEKFEIEYIIENHWRIALQHEFARFFVEIIIDDSNYLIFGSILINEDKTLYKKALDINNKINAARICLYENNLILSKHIFLEDCDEARFYRDLAYFHTTHEYVYGELNRLS